MGGSFRQLRLLVVVVLLVLVSPYAALASTAAPMPSLAAAQAEVAALVGASDPVHALSAAQALLASAGVLVSSDLQHPAQAPSGITVTPAQLNAIATDGQARATVSRVTLRDLASVLVRLGVPVHADRDPAFALEKALAAWLAAAKAHPEDPGSGAVFALAALAQRQNPPIDIGTANYDPSVLRLGLLDLELFIAGAAEATSAARQALGVGPARAAPQRTATLWSALDGLFDGRAYAADESPCAAVQATLDGLSPLVGGTWAYAAGHVGPEAVSRYAGGLGYLLSTDLSAAANAAQVGKAMGDLLGALGVLAQVQALAELYHNTTAKLTVLTGDTVHEADEHGPDKEAKVRLIAGISDADWAKAQHSALDTFSAQVKDCLTKLGLPTTTSAQDLAGSMKGWRVRWGLENTDGAAFINGATDFAFPGDLMDYLQPLNDHQSTAVLRVGVAHEQDKDHPGDLVPVKVTVTAAVVTDALPNVGTFAGGAESASAALAPGGGARGERRVGGRRGGLVPGGPYDQRLDGTHRDAPQI